MPEGGTEPVEGELMDLRFDAIVPNLEGRFSEATCRELATAALGARGLVPVGFPTTIHLHVDGSMVMDDAWSFSWHHYRSKPSS